MTSLEPSTAYRGLCLIGGCIIREGICVNCGATVPADTTGDG